MPTLVLRIDNQKEKRFIFKSPSITIGRGAECNIKLTDERVSRQHCRIVTTPEGSTIVDLGSGNETRVNGVIIKEHKLQPNDRIKIGPVEFYFSPLETSSAQSPMTEAVPEKPTGVPSGLTSAHPTQKMNISSVRTTARLPTAPTPPPSQPAPSPKAKLMETITQYFSDRKRLKWIIAGAGGAVALIVSVILLFSSGGPSRLQLQDTLDRNDKEIDRLAKEEEFQKAAELCKESLSICDTLGKDFADRRKGYRHKIEQYGSAANIVLQGQTELKKLKKRVADTKRERKFLTDWEVILEDGLKLHAEYKQMRLGSEIAAVADDVREIIKAVRGVPVSQAYNEMRGAVSKLVGEGKYAEAAKSVALFIKGYPDAKDEIERAKSDLRFVQTKAKAEVEKLSKKAEELAKEKRDDAVEYLKGEKPRFAGTEAEAEIDNLIKRFSSPP